MGGWAFWLSTVTEWRPGTLSVLRGQGHATRNDPTIYGAHTSVVQLILLTL